MDSVGHSSGSAARLGSNHVGGHCSSLAPAIASLVHRFAVRQDSWKKKEDGTYYNYKEIAELFDVQYQTTLLIFKDKKLVYRSIGETTKDLIYKAIQSSI